MTKDLTAGMPMELAGKSRTEVGEMGEFSRKPEGSATSAAKLKVAIALFLAATFGLLALLSVPVSTLIPAVPRVPHVIGGLFDPLDPLFRPFLGDGLAIGPDVTAGGVIAGITGSDAGGFQATNPTHSPPPPPPSEPPPPPIPGPPI